MDTKTWVLCNFHVSWNIPFVLLFSQPFKHGKALTVFRHIKNRQWLHLVWMAEFTNFESQCSLLQVYVSSQYLSFKSHNWLMVFLLSYLTKTFKHMWKLTSPSAFPFENLTSFISIATMENIVKKTANHSSVFFFITLSNIAHHKILRIMFSDHASIYFTLFLLWFGSLW